MILKTAVKLSSVGKPGTATLVTREILIHFLYSQ